MAAYVALLRAVNLGPHGKVAMPALRDMVAGLGYDDVKTLLTSGNVVFRSDSKPKDLEERLEAEAERKLGLRTDVMIRTGEDLGHAVDANPFPREAEEDPGHLLVLFLKEAVKAPAVEALRAAVTGREVVRGEGRQVYVYYPDGVGTSKLTNAVIERKLGTRGTGRNWNTVLKLRNLAG